MPFLASCPWQLRYLISWQPLLLNVTWSFDIWSIGNGSHLMHTIGVYFLVGQWCILSSQTMMNIAYCLVWHGAIKGNEFSYAGLSGNYTAYLLYLFSDYTLCPMLHESHRPTAKSHRPTVSIRSYQWSYMHSDKIDRFCRFAQHHTALLLLGDVSIWQ